MEDLKIVYLSPDALTPYERNARRHGEADLRVIENSIRENGFCDPIGIWGENNLIVEGHGRLLAAKNLGLESVPCIRLDHLTEAQRREYALTHNKSAELSGWDFAALEEELNGLEAEFDMAAFGFEKLEREAADWFDREEKDGDATDGEDEEYADFVDKFKPKKTTDDCYTPGPVYDAVAEWCAKEYGVSRESFVRPFYPGGDYQRETYPDGCVVVDNPPFSILTEIVHFYMANEIRFLLFAPTLTLFTARGEDVCYIPTYCSITYENGAKVNTSFITNLDRYRIRTSPELCKAVREADEKVRAETHKEIPKYSYPDYVVTAAVAAGWSRYGVDFRVLPEECVRISQLDAQKNMDKALFGGGYLLSEKAAAEKAAAEKAAAEKAAAEKAAAEKAAAEKAAAHRWELSPREREIVRELSAASR